MIRHIVFFKFKESTSNDEREKLISALEGLKDKIEVVRELIVGRDIGNKPNSCHIALDSTFETFDDVEAYAVHPDHMEVVKMVKEVCESSLKVDYEF
ncbi:MAG: Dabb family protein [Deltaproteobacteria bacterium]|nr:Dabb family protein [Deltaproteobacteria bacterium]